MIKLIIVCLIVLAVALYFYSNKQKVMDFLKDEETRMLIRDYCIEAEKKIIDDALNTKRGKDRMDYVINELYVKVIPEKLKKFITREQLVAVVEEIFKQISITLKNGHTVAR